MFWSQGWIDTDEYLDDENGMCEEISNDPLFDEAAKQVIEEIGVPMYNIWAYKHSIPYALGARNL